MPARHPHNISFTETHEGVLEYIQECTKDTISEILRRILDDYIDRYPDVVLEYQKKKVKKAEQQLEIERKRESHFAQFNNRSPLLDRSPKTTSEQKEPGPLSGHDQFAYHVCKLGTYGNLGNAARRIVNAHLKDHPEWLSEVPPEKRYLLEAPK